MLKTVHGILNPDGTVTLAEPVKVEGERHVLVTVLETEEDEEFIRGIPVTALLSEKSLAKDWLRPEEDEAWKHLQPET